MIASIQEALAGYVTEFKHSQKNMGNENNTNVTENMENITNINPNHSQQTVTNIGTEIGADTTETLNNNVAGLQLFVIFILEKIEKININQFNQELHILNFNFITIITHLKSEYKFHTYIHNMRTYVDTHAYIRKTQQNTYARAHTPKNKKKK